MALSKWLEGNCFLIFWLKGATRNTELSCIGMNGNGGGGELGKVGAGLQAGGKRQAGCQLNLLLQLTHILG